MRKDTEKADEWKPTSNDTRVLRDGMAKFTPTIVNGKKQYPFEQYCASEGIISFGEKGQVQIKSIFNWGRILKTWDLMKWQDEQDMEKLFNAFPEERVAYELKLESVKNEIRALFTSMKVQTS